jgi:uncharacterized membrane protein YjjB (DUF3815 family)
MLEFLDILFKAFWVGCAAVGFGILFNLPGKYLSTVWIGGAIVGFIKFGVLFYVSDSVILATFLAAIALGIYSAIIANKRHRPSMIFAIPPIISLVPGVLSYRTMYGLIKLTSKANADFSRVMAETVRNGILTLLIIVAFTIGVIIPAEIGRTIFKKTKPR